LGPEIRGRDYQLEIEITISTACMEIGKLAVRIFDCALRINILIVLFHLIHQKYSRLLFQKALVAYISDSMFPISHRHFENRVHVTS
jgi:hypothetical protein